MNRVRRVTWLLFTLLIAVAFTTYTEQRKVEAQSPAHYHASQRPQAPDIVMPSGVFADVFDAARPATLRIETRTPVVMGAPLGVGTGFFISADGLVLTAYHVVDTTELPDNVRGRTDHVAVTPDGTEFELDLLAFDAYLDLALLKTEVASDVPFLPVTTMEPEVGTDVVAIGNSGDDFLAGRAGSISRIGVKSPQARFANDTIELTAALSPGDSGGPVINEAGELVGVVSYISFRPDILNSDTDSDVPPYLRPFVQSGGPRTYASYAVPVTSDSEVLTALLAGERRDIPVIGFSWPNFDYNPRTSRFDLGELPGPVVGTVQPGGPADKAGLESLRASGNLIESADVIVAVDDELTPGFYDLLDVLYRKGVGSEVDITVQRGGGTITLSLELGAKSDVFR